MRGATGRAPRGHAGVPRALDDQGLFPQRRENARAVPRRLDQSGDRAYIAGGDIHITGRVKDIIIRAGRNTYPHEIEEAISAIPGIRKGGVAAFGSPTPRTAPSG